MKISGGIAGVAAVFTVVAAVSFSTASCEDEDSGVTYETVCTDAIDNDADGYTDCEDPDCDNAPACRPTHEVDCSDGKDNDADGFTDCEDMDCFNHWECDGHEADCADGVDEDSDGQTDCADLDCALDPDCLP